MFKSHYRETTAAVQERTGTAACRVGDVLRAFASVNPVTLAVDAARALTIGHGHALAPALGTVAWLAGLLLVFVPLAVRAFRRA